MERRTIGLITNLSKINYFLLNQFSDYVGFIKKIMKLMQNEFPMFRKIEVELTQEKELEKIPDRPSRFIIIF